MSEDRTVQLPQEVLTKLEQRAADTNFDSVDSYIRFILEEVIYQLDEPQETVNKETVRDRLESLGYVE